MSISIGTSAGRHVMPPRTGPDAGYIGDDRATRSDRSQAGQLLDVGRNEQEVSDFLDFARGMPRASMADAVRAWDMIRASQPLAKDLAVSDTWAPVADNFAVLDENLDVTGIDLGKVDQFVDGHALLARELGSITTATGRVGVALMTSMTGGSITDARDAIRNLGERHPETTRENSFGRTLGEDLAVNDLAGYGPQRPSEAYGELVDALPELAQNRAAALSLVYAHEPVDELVAAFRAAQAATPDADLLEIAQRAILDTSDLGEVGAR